MKTYHLIPLLFLTACSTTPKITLQPLPPPAAADDPAVRYPEIINAYHIGRYVDPNDDLVMHEQHVVYRVEENTRWNFHPGPVGGGIPELPPTRDAGFAPVPVNDAILAEVNSQKAATAQIMVQVRTLSAALSQFQSALQQAKTNLQETAVLRATVNTMRKRLDAIETAQSELPQAFIAPTTNEPPDSLIP
jgi:uncharacterized protein (DUF2267 family)